MKLNTPIKPDAHNGIVDANNEPLLSFWHLDHRDEVIRRVNAHDALLAALKQATAKLNQCGDFGGDYGPVLQSPEMQATICELFAAIAEGEAV